jgi:multiple sugar transport system ATP-binding protein
MASVEMRDVVKSYGQTIAVNHVNLKIEDGEFLILLGPSGCGKTTSLRSIAGLEAIDEGQIIIDGEVVNDKRPADRDMAFCFQQYALYPHLTAYENIAFPLRTQKMNNREVEQRVKEVGSILHLEEIFKRKPSKLSAGDQQRVALARAMVRHPKVYLMDEPLSNLDAQIRVDMRVELRRIQINNKTTTVYVTHDQVEAMAMADRIAIMNQGHLQQVGTPDEVYAYPANLFVANFIGSPSMNFISCEFEAASHSIQIRTNGDTIHYKLPEEIKQSVSGLADGTELVLGIRPEDINIFTEPQEDGFECKFILVEALGSENIHHIGHGELYFVVRTSPAEVFSEGQTLWVTFEPAGVRLFDRKTEAAI